MIEGLALGVGSIVFVGIAVVVVKPVIERADLLWSTELRLLGESRAVLSTVVGAQR